MSAIQHCLLWSPKLTSCLWDTELPDLLSLHQALSVSWIIYCFCSSSWKNYIYYRIKNLLSDIFSCCIFLSLISHKLINPWTEVEMHLIICSHRIYWSELSSLLSGTSCVVVIDSLISRKKTLGKCHIKLNFSGSFFFFYPFFISAMPVWPHQQYLPGVFGLWYQESMRNSAKHSS